jgi:hypothetical protein
MSYIDNQAVKLRDSAGSTVNPAEDETIIMLRRLVKLAETLAVTDANQRQRVTIDAGTLPTVSTVSTVSNLVLMSGVDTRFHFVDTARNAYANGIRSKLEFS